MAAGQKVRTLNNSFYRANEKKRRQNDYQMRIKRVHKKRFIIAILAFFLIVTFFGYQIVNTKLLTSNLNKQITVSQKKLDSVRAQRASLKEKVKQLNDENYLEKIIREKYYYSKDGETIYSLPNNSLGQK
ncbi:FtsB family cell division protein [Liquorilactobacillus mali]|uniref:Cell division protein DIVIC n=1 Tax=Liquorilactobacillus mali KCTC 3596 = DSM 20444 TaxID=1046596 RepID=J1F5P4_9LACO|nr:septum formation initiator family protein [Liquorilactobacillus mali]EJF01987.1 cell division protein DIVIC [Liquorilactobacillus mali KCTC 3596 = DSM 20444]KRN08841.1 cell division protein DIVIC [Liquorilactobacillus mali KCTC 3596 = DSM 20444]MDV7758658.1 septum formation initiator family protein [Liquorilactobacillus mali]QFQ74117.1 septum formation initiator family protein [Liquorilactobacillus mali]